METIPLDGNNIKSPLLVILSLELEENIEGNNEIKNKNSF